MAASKGGCEDLGVGDWVAEFGFLSNELSKGKIRTAKFYTDNWEYWDVAFNGQVPHSSHILCELYGQDISWASRPNFP